MLSTSAFNALLKTLEEPPAHLLFMFATTESHKVPATIVSRCQRFDFRRMQVDAIVNHLSNIARKESIRIDEASLIAIAKKGDGSMRDSQSIFDQVRAFCGDDIRYSAVTDALHLLDEEFFFTISDAIIARNSSIMFSLVDQIMRRGYDMMECLSGLQLHFRNILSVLSTGSVNLIETSHAIQQRYTETSAHFRLQNVLRIMSMLTSAEQQLKYTAQPRARFEVLLVSLASLDDIVDISELLGEIREAKKGGTKIGMLSSVVHATMPSPPPDVVARREAQSVSAARATPTAAPVRTSGSATSPAARMAAVSSAPTSSSATAVSSSVASQATSSKEAVSVESLEERWMSFVKSLPDTLASSKMTLASAQYSHVSFAPGEVHVRVLTQRFMYEDLTANRAKLTTALERFFGSVVRVHVAFNDDESEEAAANTGTDAGTGSASAAAATVRSANATIPTERSVVEQKLVDLFGAKKIPLPGT